MQSESLVEISCVSSLYSISRCRTSYSMATPWPKVTDKSVTILWCFSRFAALSSPQYCRTLSTASCAAACQSLLEICVSKSRFSDFVRKVNPPPEVGIAEYSSSPRCIIVRDLCVKAVYGQYSHSLNSFSTFGESTVMYKIVS